MNPFTEPTVAKPLKGAAACWSAPATPHDGVCNAPNVGKRTAPMSRFLRRRRRAPQSEAAAPSSGGLKRLASQTVVALGLALACSAPAWAVDVNRASAQELQSVRGIGPKTAQAIVGERMRGGSFESFQDLSERVKGIGAKKVQSLQAAGLTLSGAASPTISGIGKVGQ